MKYMRFINLLYAENFITDNQSKQDLNLNKRIVRGIIEKKQDYSDD